jgi:hypothetical protein
MRHKWLPEVQFATVNNDIKPFGFPSQAGNECDGDSSGGQNGYFEPASPEAIARGKGVSPVSTAYSTIS